MRAIPELFAQPHTKLVPFITAGYPQKNITLELALAAERAGAHMLEIGMPFSDPLADGPIIQDASQTALQNGTTLPSILELVADLKRSLSIPLVLMGYFNPILQYGEERFIASAADSGVDGLIIPDLPPGQRDQFLEAVLNANMSVIPLVAPNTPMRRISKIGAQYSDLLYAVSMMGVTGSKQTEGRSSEPLDNYLNGIRRASEVPFMVGFGIETPADAARVGTMADGVVVGSALLKRLETAEDPVAVTHDYVASLVRAVE